MTSCALIRCCRFLAFFERDLGLFYALRDSLEGAAARAPPETRGALCEALSVGAAGGPESDYGRCDCRQIAVRLGPVPPVWPGAGRKRVGLHSLSDKESQT